jgi:hypothetical protein
MSPTSIYEEALYSESFRNNILKNRYSTNDLIQLVKENKLNSHELKVLHELAPNVATGNPQTPVQPQPQQQNTSSGYKPNVKPQQNATQQSWNKTVQAIKSSGLVNNLKQLQASNPNDKYVSDVIKYIFQSLTDLNNHLNPAPQQNQTAQQNQQVPQNMR